MNKAFVAGATGYTGREVVRALRKREIEVVAHIRPGSKAGERASPEFEALGASVDHTPWEPLAMAETMRRAKPSMVFALLGTTRKRAKAEDSLSAREAYEQIDYGLSALLLQAVLEADIRPRFVYLSSLGVKAGAKSPYFAVRARFERELRESGLPFTILRPSFIAGDREEPRPGESVAAAVTDIALGLAGALGAQRFRARYASIDAQGLAEALVSSALDPAREGATLHLDDLRS